MTTVHITMIEIGTNNAACKGLDESFPLPADRATDLEAYEQELRDTAGYNAECQGYDMEKYEFDIEFIDSDDEDEDDD